jgi:hypothetical protein
VLIISNPFAYLIVLSWIRPVLVIFFEISFLHEATRIKMRIMLEK